MIVSYKEELEISKNIYDIQNAYERECYRRSMLLLEMFPEEFERMMLSEHFLIWLTAEKYAVNQFGTSKTHWIKQKI